MRFVKRAVVFFLRPIYRAFFEEPLWWFLAKVKSFFFAETNTHLAQMSTQILEVRSKEQDLERRLGTIEERLGEVDRNNAAQWDALEQLLLALFRHPEPHDFGSGRKSSQSQNLAISNSVELSHIDESNNIR